MKFFKRTVIFKVRVVYKSGYTHDFEVTAFEITKNATGGISAIHWNPIADRNKPVYIGLDEIVAVWQVGVRYTYQWR